MQKYALWLFLFFALARPSRAEVYPKCEVRAVWISTIFGMDWPSKPATGPASRAAQQRELCALLDKLAAARFNTVFLQVRLRGDLIYPSAIEPMSRFIAGRTGGDPGYDPLAFAIAECHRRHLECHAWIVTYPLGSADYVRREGAASPVHRRPELCRFFNGQWYLDPGLPSTDDYIMSIVDELVEKYDLDGLHFDYIRYPDESENFPDEDTYRRFGAPENLRAWREGNVNRLVARIYDYVKQHKPWMQVSTSPLGKYSALNRVPDAGLTGLSVYQNSFAWLQGRKQDMVAPMLYFRDRYFYPFVEHWMQNRYGRLLVVGLGAYRLAAPQDNWPLSVISSQMDFLRRTGVDGLAFFRARQVTQNCKGLYTLLKNKYFRYPALLPPLTWLSAVKPPAPEDLQVTREGRRLHLSWSMPGGDSPSIIYTVYASHQTEVNTSSPVYILATGLKKEELYLELGSAEQEEGFCFRVTASDRYHNESAPSEDLYYYVSPYLK